MVKIGDAVIYVDPLAQPRPALVTAVWGSSTGEPQGPAGQPSLNLVIVSDDRAKEDSYGRQIERATSIVHQSGQAAHGNFWREAA